MKYHHSYISICVAYLMFHAAARSTSPDVTTIFHASLYHRFIEIQRNLRRNKLHGTTQGSNFLLGIISNRYNTKASIKFRKERQPQHQKRLFFLKNRPMYFNINNRCLYVLVISHTRFRVNPHSIVA